MSERDLIAKADQVRGSRDTLREIFARGTLRVLVEFSPPPSEGPPPEFYHDPETGEPTGVACELGKLMAKDLGVEVEWVDIPWPEQIPALLGGKADLLPKHTNTSLRGLLVDFSIHRLQRIEVVAIARKEGLIKRKEDLNSEKVKIAIWHGSSNVEVARRLFPKAQIIEDQRPANLLKSGQVDALIEDGVTRVSLERLAGCDIVRDERGEREILNLEYGYPAVFPGDTRFLNWLNNFMIYRWNDGTLKYWAETWWDSWMAM
ncbi:MAG: transporter substrate-binding domain-containing protein [Anaerolineae bacterium]|nr:transporter substrate-binding domain-containing protein [Anaerolineae bacterium]